MTSNNVLYVIAQNPLYNQSDKIPYIKSLLARDDIRPFLDVDFIEDYIAKKSEDKTPRLLFNWYPKNAPCRYLKEHLDTPGVLIEEPISLDRLTQTLASEKFTHVCIAGYLNGQKVFEEAVAFIRTNYPEIKIIALANAALLADTKGKVDYCLTGDTVTQMKNILGESLPAKFKPVIVKATTNSTFGGITKSTVYGLLITGFGCRYACDFCPSTAQWGNKESYVCTVDEIYETILHSRETLGLGDKPEITLSLAEPQGMGNLIWKEVFEKCKDLPFKCNLVTTTSSKVIAQYDIDTLTKGNLRLSTVNIGVETLLNGGYPKNWGVDLKAAIKRLQDSGIKVVLTYIIGFPHQNYENVIEEIHRIKELGASSHIVANLELQPGTPLFNQYQKDGLTLGVPSELYAVPGHQAYKHPVFQPGFKDLTTLLDKANEILDGTVTQLGVSLEDQILEFKENFTQIDLFHPYILTTN